MSLVKITAFGSVMIIRAGLRVRLPPGKAPEARRVPTLAELEEAQPRSQQGLRLAVDDDPLLLQQQRIAGDLVAEREGDLSRRVKSGVHPLAG